VAGEVVADCVGRDSVEPTQACETPEVALEEKERVRATSERLADVIREEVDLAAGRELEPGDRRRVSVGE
jgi:hypothetical protein